MSGMKLLTRSRIASLLALGVVATGIAGWLTFAACTVQVDPPVDVTIDVKCNVVELPGGQTSLVCPDAGIVDAKRD